MVSLGHNELNDPVMSDLQQLISSGTSQTDYHVISLYIIYIDNIDNPLILYYIIFMQHLWQQHLEQAASSIGVSVIMESNIWGG